MAVDDVVDQAVEQVADARPGEVRTGIPVGNDRADVESVVLPDGDQRSFGDKGGQLAGGQLASGNIEADRVGREEQVAAVAVEFRALVLVHGVFHGHRVQPEFGAEDGQVLAIRVAQVQPDDGGV